MVSVEDRPAILEKCVVVAPLGDQRPDLIHRPGEDFASATGVLCRPKPALLSLSGRHSGRFEQCSTAATNMRCMITASLRASATFAFFMPARLAVHIAQLEGPCSPSSSGWVRMIWPASESAVRTPSLPITDPSSDVRFTGLIFSSGQPEMRPDPLPTFQTAPNHQSPKHR